MCKPRLTHAIEAIKRDEARTALARSARDYEANGAEIERTEKLIAGVYESAGVEPGTPR